MNNISEKPDEDFQSNDNEKNISSKGENELYNELIKKFETTQVIAHNTDHTANSIPLGSFCFAVSFILYGFYECKVHKDEDNILYMVILFFGGIGQLTAGIFEILKSRTYPATLYITYSLYFLSFYFAKKNDIFNKADVSKIYFGTWIFLGAPLILLSLRINLFFLIQNISAVAFFVIKTIGYCCDSGPLKGVISGILELVAGFSSIYICFGQILNQHFSGTILPTIPFKKNNEVDKME